MKTYRAMISVTMHEDSFAAENEQLNAVGGGSLTEEDIRLNVANVLFEVIQNMVLDRHPFMYEFSVSEEWES